MTTTTIKTARGTVDIVWTNDANDSWASARLNGHEIAFNALSTGIEFIGDEGAKFSDEERAAITAALEDCWDENNEY